MKYITFNEIVYRIKAAIEIPDIQSKIDLLCKLSKDVHNSREYIGSSSSFIIESIKLLIDMIDNDKCVYMRNDILDTSEKICDIIFHMELQSSVTYQ